MDKWSTSKRMHSVPTTHPTCTHPIFSKSHPPFNRQWPAFFRRFLTTCSQSIPSICKRVYDMPFSHIPYTATTCIYSITMKLPLIPFTLIQNFQKLGIPHLKMRPPRLSRASIPIQRSELMSSMYSARKTVHLILHPCTRSTPHHISPKKTSFRGILSRRKSCDPAWPGRKFYCFSLFGCLSLCKPSVPRCNGIAHPPLPAANQRFVHAPPQLAFLSVSKPPLR